MLYNLKLILIQIDAMCLLNKQIHDASKVYKVSTRMHENQVSSSMHLPVNFGHVTHFIEEYREDKKIKKYQ